MVLFWMAMSGGTGRGIISPLFCLSVRVWRCMPEPVCMFAVHGHNPASINLRFGCGMDGVESIRDYVFQNFDSDFSTLT